MQNMTQAELQVGKQEKQNGVLSHPGGYGKETDSLPIINMKNLQDSNCQGTETDNSVVLKREGESFWAASELECSKVVHHVIQDRKIGGQDSLNENDLGEVLYNQRGTRGSKTDEENRDKLSNGPESDCANCDEHELPVPGAQIITSKLFQTDSSMYTDKSVMECEVPQLTVCCKDIDCQHVKDICVDKGEPVEEKGLVDKYTDNFVGRHVSKPSSEWTNKTTKDQDYEFHIPDGLRPQVQADFRDATVDRCEAKEEREVITPVPSKSECPSAGRVREYGPNPEVSLQANENNVGNKIEKNVLVEEPLVTTTMLPLDKFGTSVPRSSMDSLNGQGDEVAQPSNQSMKVRPKSPEAGLESEESSQNHADRINLDFSHEPTASDSRGMSDEVSEKPWMEEIVPNHKYRNLTDPLAAHVVQHANMDEREGKYVLNCESRSSSNPFLVSEIQCSGKDGSTEDTHRRTLLKNMEVRSTNPFAVEVESAIVEVNHKENFNPFAFGGRGTEKVYQVPDDSPKRRSTNNPFDDYEVENVGVDKNCDSFVQQPANPFSASEVHSSSKAKGIQHNEQQPELNHKGTSYNPFAISDSEGAATVDKNAGDTGTELVLKQQSVELIDLHNHGGAPKNASLIDKGEGGIGQTSFSAVSGRITYSGPIAFSGSISLRSDSSTTSTRSFAFPVLQSEWNSSPVRMEKADRRKQRGGWKHSILCCCNF